MTRNYKDYQIRVFAIENDLGTGLRAEFFIPKINSGIKSKIRAFETYEKGKKPGMVITEVQRIIDTLE